MRIQSAVGIRMAAVAGLILFGLVASPALAAAAGGEAAKVDINKAGHDELTSLPGIGPALAGRILEYREEFGPFQRIEDLMNVRGIGEKNFLKLRDLITVGKEGSGRR